MPCGSVRNAWLSIHIVTFILVTLRLVMRWSGNFRGCGISKNGADLYRNVNAASKLFNRSQSALKRGPAEADSRAYIFVFEVVSVLFSC